ncbi:hypothetical protein [Haloarchaeobius sp. DFWS5]|uniref:hypothetical protein n=1 Tax=Haloarchaeobius sp. DFWS5 TaxID=3446114 RepID=UPI003EC044BB
MSLLQAVLGLFGLLTIFLVGGAFVAFPEEMLKLRFAHVRAPRRYLTKTRVVFYRLVGVGVVLMGLLGVSGYLF